MLLGPCGGRAVSTLDPGFYNGGGGGRAPTDKGTMPASLSKVVGGGPGGAKVAVSMVPISDGGGGGAAREPAAGPAAAENVALECVPASTVSPSTDSLPVPILEREGRGAIASASAASPGGAKAIGRLPFFKSEAVLS